MRWLRIGFVLALAACGTAAATGAKTTAGSDDGGVGQPVSDAAVGDSGTSGSADGGGTTIQGNDGGGNSANLDGGSATQNQDGGSAMENPDGGCPSGYTAGTANGLPVCRAASGIPLFSNVFVVLMENTSLSTLAPALADGGAAPNLGAMARTYATGSDYHGVAHPSLPNYIALASGSTQGITCDCEAIPDAGTCGLLCNATFNVGTCTCSQNAQSIADQLETAGKTWMAFGEDMGASTPCNLVTAGNYAVRHVPFLYFDDIQANATRCDSHVVDFSFFDVSSAPSFTFIAPNLIDDMHNPDPTNSTNIPDGDEWIGPQVAKIVASKAYASGGLLVVVWDEDDLSGAGPLNTDNPVPIFVLSPYAKSGGYVSSIQANHYSLLATFEDGLGLPRLGSAATATPLTDYFPAQ